MELPKITTKTADQFALRFIKEFIENKQDVNIPLSDTYRLYIEFMKERFPEKPIRTETAFHRMTTDYFYKKPGAKNYKAASLEEMEENLDRKQKAINRDMKLLKRLKENRTRLLLEEFTQ